MKTMSLKFYQLTLRRQAGVEWLRMNVEAAQLNLLFAWVWILLGFVSGMILGLFFRGENWLGGYGSFKRRMYRLGHISFFGLGAVNLLFWLTMQKIHPSSPLAAVASWAFIIGGVTMPLCCAVMAQRPKAHLIFSVPVMSLIAGGVLMLILIQQTHNLP
jgi:hypothetical protein